MKLRNSGMNPPGCFFFVVRETGHRIPSHGSTSLDACYIGVKEHLRINGYDIPVGLRAQIEDFCCQRKESLGWCMENSGAPGPDAMPAAQGWTMGLQRIAQGTKTLASWLTEGREELPVAQRRAAVCAACPENRPIEQSSCKGCSAVAFNRFVQLVAGVLKGTAPEPWEAGLKACRICGCDLRLKIRTRLSPIRRFMRDEQLAALPAHCWINTEERE